MNRRSLVLLVVALTACTSDTSDTPITGGPTAGGPGPQGSSPAVAGCPTAAATIADPEALLPGELVADVDGDGAADQAQIALAEEAGPGCSAFLVTSADDATYAAALGDEHFPVDASAVRFGEAIEVDGEPGAEVVVYLVRGASTEFVGLFSMTSGRLQRIRVQGGPYGDLFPTGGSVGHLEASDCLDDGRIVTSTALPRGAGYSVERTTLAYSEGSFESVDVETVRVRDPQDLEQFQEFITTPFGNCRSE